MSFSRIIPLAFLILYSLNLTAQTPFADSLKRVLVKAKSDTMRVNMLGELAYIMRSVNPDTALILGRESYELARSLDFTQKLDNILRVIGIIHFADQNPDSALWYFDRAKEIATQTGDLGTLVNTINGEGFIYKTQDSISQALEAYQRALKIDTERGHKTGQGVALNNIGTIYLDQKNYKEAANYFQQGLNIQQEMGNKSFQALILNNLGLVASHQNNLDQALKYYEQALELTKILKDKESEATVLAKIGRAYKLNGRFSQSLQYYFLNLQISKELSSQSKIANSLTSLGSVYEATNDLDTALTYYERALDIQIEAKNKYYQAIGLGNIGNIYVKKKEFRKALSYLNQSLKLREELGVKSKTRYSFQMIGSCYEQLNELDSAIIYLEKALALSKGIRGEDMQANTLLSLGKTYQKQGRLAEAIAMLEEGLEVSTSAGLRKVQSEASKILYRLYKAQNNIDLALQYLEMHKSLQDSLFNRENTRALAQIETDNKYKQEKQRLAFEQEQNLAEEKNTQKIIGIALAIAILMIIAIAWYYIQKQRANELLLELNEEVHAQKTKLEELDEMKSRFFTNISHEFRTPLTVIGGMAAQIRQEPKKWMEKGLELIQRNNHQLLDLVNQILDLRKLESGTMTLDMHQGDIIFYVRYLMESFHSLAESKGIELHFLCEMKELHMDFDREKLLRVISNMMSNAIKFTPEEGNVYMSVSRQQWERDSQNITKSNEQLPTNGLLLMIKDTGVGIPAEKLPYIFDRFYQGDDSDTRQGEGTGIGLALTKELVKLMGGEISVTSEINKGSVFKLKLPISQNAPLESLIKTNEALAPPNSSTSSLKVVTPKAHDLAHKLLIIEDNNDVVTYLESILPGHYALIIARDGNEGIEKAIDEVPDLIISDIMMPYKDGFEVCKILKEDLRTSHIPIVLLTAKADIDSRLDGLRRGADAYLTKPFNQQELLIRLEQLLKLRQHLQGRYQTLEPLPPTKEVQLQQEDKFILEVRALIEKHLQDTDFGIPILCKAMGMSRTQLHLKIKALTKHSASHYIRAIRLHKAKTLLESSDLTISEIAYEVGFSDPSYFSRTFSEEFGQSPRSFQKP